jgi:hypothetical protein
MKRLCLIVLILLTTGCASMADDAWWQHRTHYASWEHQRFSMYGYKNPTMQDVEFSKAEGWWGTMVSVPSK